MVPKIIAAAIRRWPSTDLAELLELVTGELHTRAQHARETKARATKRVDAGRAKRAKSGDR